MFRDARTRLKVCCEYCNYIKLSNVLVVPYANKWGYTQWDQEQKKNKTIKIECGMFEGD